MSASSKDPFGHVERSEIMRAVKATGTSAETLLSNVLDEMKVGFRSQAADLPGRPDFVLDDVRLAIFVDGDFWHGRPWFERGLAPESNRDYWVAKFERNRDRDIRADRSLRRRGWSVLRIWESDLRREPSRIRLLVASRVRRRGQRLGASAG